MEAMLLVIMLFAIPGVIVFFIMFGSRLSGLSLFQKSAKRDIRSHKQTAASRASSRPSTLDAKPQQSSQPTAQRPRQVRNQPLPTKPSKSSKVKGDKPAVVVAPLMLKALQDLDIWATENLTLISPQDQNRVLDDIESFIDSSLDSVAPFRARMTSSVDPAENVNMEFLYLLRTTLRRAYVYRVIATEFISKYYFKLGPRASMLLSTHFVRTAVEKQLVAHENELVRLIYLLKPSNPVYDSTAMSFERELEQQPKLYKQYERSRTQFNDIATQYNALVEMLQGNPNAEFEFRLGNMSSNPFAFTNDPTMNLESLQTRLGVLRVEVEQKHSRLSSIRERLDEARNDISSWIERHSLNFAMVDSEESKLRKSMAGKDRAWLPSTTEAFLACREFLYDSHMIYEASCFCDNVAIVFGDTPLPRRVRSVLIRTQADFLKSVYRESVQKIGTDDTQEYAVHGPTYFLLENTIDSCGVSFLIVGPTVEEVKLAANKGRKDSTTFEIKPGYYTLVCEPIGSPIMPLILEGECLPGRQYPVSVTSGTNASSDSKRHTLGRGYTTGQGIFGAVDLNPVHPLEFLFENRRYRLERFLGMGSGGFVHQATELASGRPSAFKFMTATRFSGYRDIDYGRSEWVTFNQLQDTTYLVNIRCFSEDITFFQQDHELNRKTPIAAYEMNFAPHGDLRNFVENDRNGILKLNEIFLIMQNICRGLFAIHQSGLIHRDLRPKNILVFSEYPNFRICDFTLTMNKVSVREEQLKIALSDGSNVIDTDSLSEEKTIGTLQSFQKIVCASTFYSAPEEHSGHGKLDARSDIYSLGGILYWLLVGFDPFELQLREYDRELYDRYALARDERILHLDLSSKRKLFGDLVLLNAQMREANLAIKANTAMELDYEEIECPDLERHSFEMFEVFLQKTLDPDPNLRYQSAAEALKAIEAMVQAM